MKRPTNKPATAPQIRVAIYTRQSVASNLEFGSIDAQREAVAAYIASQRGEGWVEIPERYDDHGFSGGNTDRPAFQRLLRDIEAGKVDVIAAYKTDRVSRSLPDFTSFMAMLEKLGVGFVSTTQAFDTRTSMGRFTLNMLASFSQFEREVISERTRDKITATRRKGMFTGGRPPLGYDVVDKALVVNPTEAEIVQQIFALYLDHGGLVATVEELQRRGIRNKSWTNKAGKQVLGAPFDKAILRTLLTNPIYTGRIRCGGELVEARHAAIIELKTFTEVARALRERRPTYRIANGKWGALLSGILVCGQCGAAMAHAANVRGARVHRYYACSTLQKRGAAACPGSRAPAAEIEDVVLNQIRTIGQDPAVLVATLTAARNARQAQVPELQAEAQRLTHERTQALGQRNHLLDALQHGGAAGRPIANRIAELEDQITALQDRLDAVAERLAGFDGSPLDEAAVRDALAQFTATWDELTPRDRQRALRLLVEAVRFDAKAGEVQLEFRDNGIRALAKDAAERRPA